MKKSSMRINRITAGALLGVAVSTIPIDFAEARRFRLGTGVRAVGAGGGAIAKSYTADHLTLEQLKICVGTEGGLEKLSANLEQRSTALTLAQAAIGEEKKAIEEAEARLNRRNQRAVDQFNASIKRYNDSIGTNREAIDTYNRDVESQKVEVSQFNAICGGKRNFEDELALALTHVGVD